MSVNVGQFRHFTDEEFKRIGYVVLPMNVEKIIDREREIDKWSFLQELFSSVEQNNWCFKSLLRR